MYQGSLYTLWRRYKKNTLGMLALVVLGLFACVGLYAPLFTSSKPLLIQWNGKFYSPLFRYLFYAGYYTKPIDLFFNVLMCLLPFLLLALLLLRGKSRLVSIGALSLLQFLLFGWILVHGVRSPTIDSPLSRQERIGQPTYVHTDPLLAPLLPATQKTWSSSLAALAPYTQIVQLLDYRHAQQQHSRLLPHQQAFAEKTGRPMPTLWLVQQRHQQTRLSALEQVVEQIQEKYTAALEALPEAIAAYRPYSHAITMATHASTHSLHKEEQLEAEKKLAQLLLEITPYKTTLSTLRQTIHTYYTAHSEKEWLIEKARWLEEESQKLRVWIPPLIRTFHWEEDAGGSQETNPFLPWWERTRVNRKDLVAGLLFGIRVSMVVGFLAVGLALCISIPLGMISGYFAGKTDLIICRLIEIWEAMPTFFMLLLVVAITQSKSIFLVISIIGLFGWTGFSRFIRSEVLRQRKLPYVQACHCLGYTHRRIMYSHILPNAIPPILTLLPFAMLSAITSEAGLSFLGLGEEGSTSWGVLMDEGRSVFPAESYLLWPPAILLAILLVAIALVGDALRDAFDPKMN